MPNCDAVCVEFTAEKLLFHHGLQRDFIKPLFSVIPLAAFVTIRVVSFLYAWGQITFDMFWMSYQHDVKPYYWFIYASNWTLLTFAVMTTWWLVIVLYHNCIKNHPPEYINSTAFEIKGVSIFWFLYNISINCTFLVSIIFWIGYTTINEMSYLTDIESQVKHSIPVAIFCVDLCLTAVPIRLAHGIYPMIAGVSYIAFNGIFFLAGGRAPNGDRNIYPYIDWRRPQSAFFASLVPVFLCMFLQCVIFFVTYLRLYGAEFFDAVPPITHWDFKDMDYSMQYTNEGRAATMGDSRRLSPTNTQHTEEFSVDMDVRNDYAETHSTNSASAPYEDKSRFSGDLTRVKSLTQVWSPSGTYTGKSDSRGGTGHGSRRTPAGENTPLSAQPNVKRYIH